MIKNKKSAGTILTAVIVLFSSYYFFYDADSSQPEGQSANRWSITSKNEITWSLQKTDKAHTDHIEMSGRKVSAIITYGTDSTGRFAVSRELVWPLLRTIKHGNDKSWMAYRAYLKRTYTDDMLPLVSINGQPVSVTTAKSVIINGTLVIVHEFSSGLSLTRTFVPSHDQSYLTEMWKLTNNGKSAVNISLSDNTKAETEEGFYGNYSIYIQYDKPSVSNIAPGESAEFGIYFVARKENESVSCNAVNEYESRKEFLKEMESSLQLITPDSILNTAFCFAKIRTSESIFDTKRGLMHSPGGGRYYAGVWANDQVEYAGPFFPFLGYKPATEATANAYRIFGGDMKDDYKPIWSSHEIEGDLTCCGADRGDAAMYLYGASRFLLANGDKSLAESFLQNIKWAAEYNRRKVTKDGVIASQTDEMEGRIPTGDANLSTSSLCYGGLKSASALVGELNDKLLANKYLLMAEDLGQSIEKYFGADIDGYHTYRYYDGHTKLRHWICLPLTMGIENRAAGTMDALFNKLWTKDGLLVETGQNMFWDRGTLYALRGAFNAGATERALEKLKDYSSQRLLGDHVPYAVEAWPEGDQAHLAAESALYCRIYIEGMSGITPTGFASFSCQPRLPASWDKMELRHIKAFGHDFDIIVKRSGKETGITVIEGDKTIYRSIKEDGYIHNISFE